MQKHIFTFLGLLLFLQISLGGYLFAAGTGFEGPYYSPVKGDKIQTGCSNNYVWGKKDMTLKIGKGVKGKAQLIDIRGISSGAMQFFVQKLKLWRGHYYRIKFYARAEGFYGLLTVKVRKIGKPWNTYIAGTVITPGSEWQQYIIEGTAPTDVDSDFGLMFETATVGKIWIDEVEVTEYPQKPNDASSGRKIKKKTGNLFPRSSFEGKRDNLWASGVYGLKGGPEAEWEDPQLYRADESVSGNHSMCFPASSKGGLAFCSSRWIDVVDQEAVSLSFQAKSRKDKVVISTRVFGIFSDGKKSIYNSDITLEPEWKQYSLNDINLPSGCRKVFVYFAHLPRRDGAEVLLDAIQLEYGKESSAYTPAHKLELYCDAGQQGGNIFNWGETIPLNLLLANPVNTENKNTCKVNLKVTELTERVILKDSVELTVNKTQRLNLDIPENGIFRIRLETVPEEAAAQQEIIVAKLPEPRPVGRESAFGTHITIRPFFIDYAKKIGMKWIRLHDGSIIGKWRIAEYEPGKYKWYDAQINSVLDAGLNILGLPCREPVWRRTDPEKTGNVVDVDAYRKYCRMAAEHYKGRIDFWEAWNEPYMKTFFKGTAEQYGELLQAAYKGIKEGNTQAKVLGYCTEINDTDYAEKIPAKYREFIDILSVHCYFQNIPGGGTVSAKQDLEKYKKFLGKNYPAEVWNTEGANYALGKCSMYSFLEATPQLNIMAAAFGSRVWLEQLKGGIDKFFVYTIHQSDTIMYYGGYKKYIGYDRSITPAAASSAITAWCIDGLTPAAKQPVKEGIVQSLFTGKDRSTWAGYDDPLSKTKRYIELGDIPQEWLILDSMGNDPRSADKSQNKLSIGILPYFVMAKDTSAQRISAVCQKAVR